MSVNVKKSQQIIWSHYRTHRRTMPWRGEKDSYKILVSEIMLQQTQVSRVIPKYLEFIRVFPNIHALGKAPFSKVLRYWNGLGYNRRALALHKLAQRVVKDHQGILPKDPLILESLPGIGKATAGSIAAFSWNTRIVFIETNIRRVFIHFFFPKKNKVSDTDIIPLIEKTLPEKRVREWYYALMDYGAMLKTKENPNRRSAHYTKQSKFKGSNREVRGEIIKRLATGKNVTLKDLLSIGFEEERIQRALVSLMKDGFIAKKKGIIQINT